MCQYSPNRWRGVTVTADQPHTALENIVKDQHIEVS